MSHWICNVSHFLTYSVNYDQQLQRFSSRSALVLAIPSWHGFIYTLFHRPVRVEFADAWLPEVGFMTIGTLICSLLCFICAVQTLSDDWGSITGWLFALVCALPFFGMLWFLDPLGMSSIY